MTRVYLILMLIGATFAFPKKLQTVLEVARADQPLCVLISYPELPRCEQIKTSGDGTAVVVKNLNKDNVMIFKNDILRIKKTETLVSHITKPTMILHKNVTSNYMGYIVATKCIPQMDLLMCSKIHYNKKKRKLLDQLSTIKGVNTTVVNDTGYYHTTDLEYINVNIFS